MASNSGFVVKVLVISLALSAAIRYGAPLLSIPPSVVGVGVAVFLPSLVMAGLLWARSQAGRSVEDK